MKHLITLLIGMFLTCSIGYAADQTITITIPDEKVQTALQGFLAVYPNNEVDENGDPAYTNAQWVREKVRRNLVRDVRRGLQILAYQSSQVANDDAIAS